MISAWIMNISNFFGNIMETCIDKAIISTEKFVRIFYI